MGALLPLAGLFIAGSLPPLLTPPPPLPLLLICLIDRGWKTLSVSRLASVFVGNYLNLEVENQDGFDTFCTQSSC